MDGLTKHRHPLQDVMTIPHKHCLDQNYHTHDRIDPICPNFSKDLEADVHQTDCPYFFEGKQWIDDPLRLYYIKRVMHNADNQELSGKQQVSI